MQETAKKRKLLPWLVAVIVVVAALLILWFGGVFGGGIHSDPEKAALSFLEHYYAADYDKMCKTIYPAIVDDEFESTFTQIMAEFEAYDFSVGDFTVADRQPGDRSECDEWAQYIADDYGVQIEVSQLCYVTIEYVFSGTDDEGAPHEDTATAVVAVAQIDGAWYVVNGDESKTYGFDTPEEAVALMAADDYAFSNFTVTSKEERSSSDCADWEQRLKEEYGFEVVISELLYVEVAYDIVGTLDGETFSDTVSAFLPVAQIDGVWYVIDGAV